MISKYWKHLVAFAAGIGVLGGAYAKLSEWRWVTPTEMNESLYTVASELEEKIGTEKARKQVKEAEDDERYWEQKVKSGMWHEPAQGSASFKFWQEDQKTNRSNRQFFRQRTRDLKK